MTHESATAFREWYDLDSRSESQPSAVSPPQGPRRWSTLLPLATASVRRTTVPLHGSGNPQKELVSLSRRSRLRKWGPQGHPWRAGPRGLEKRGQDASRVGEACSPTPFRPQSDRNYRPWYEVGGGAAHRPPPAHRDSHRKDCH